MARFAGFAVFCILALLAGCTNWAPVYEACAAAGDGSYPTAECQRLDQVYNACPYVAAANPYGRTATWDMNNPNDCRTQIMRQLPVARESLARLAQERAAQARADEAYLAGFDARERPAALGLVRARTAARDRRYADSLRLLEDAVGIDSRLRAEIAITIARFYDGTAPDGRNPGGAAAAGNQAVPPNAAQARRFYQMAGDLGSHDALLALAGMYRDGRGVPADPVRGRALEAAALRQADRLAAAGDAAAASAAAAVRARWAAEAKAIQDKLIADANAKDDREKLQREADRLSALAATLDLRRYTRMIDDVIAADSLSWALNVYQRGSASDIRLIAGTGPLSLTFRLSFDYAGGRSGWVEAEVYRDQVRCLRYWDFADECRPPYNDVALLDRPRPARSAAPGSDRQRACISECESRQRRCESDSSTGRAVGLLGCGLSGGCGAGTETFLTRNCRTEFDSCRSDCRP
jgi:TPR repeat protein